MEAQAAGWYPDPDDSTQFRYWTGTDWTEHRSPRIATPAPARTGPGTVTPTAPTGRWYFVIALASAGFLASVPFFHAASRLDRPPLRKVGAAMAAAALLGFFLLSVSPTDQNGDPKGFFAGTAGIVMAAVMLVSTLLLIGLRREVYQPVLADRPATGNQLAMAHIAESRRKRTEARRLAAKDPMMARELGIGCPGSSRQYDDGGLVDLNRATPAQLTETCGLPGDVAQAVVVARTSLGRFLTVDDAIVFGQIGEEHAPTVRDRGIIIL